MIEEFVDYHKSEMRKCLRCYEWDMEETPDIQGIWEEEATRNDYYAWLISAAPPDKDEIDWAPHCRELNAYAAEITKEYHGLIKAYKQRERIANGRD